MKPLSFLILIYLSTLSQCIETTLSPSKPSSFTQDQGKSVLPEPIARNRRRHKPHKYDKSKTYFRWELPDDTSGWNATGSNKSLRWSRNKNFKTTSINPNTGKPRQGVGSCDGERDGEPYILDDYECCLFLWYFRLGPDMCMVCRTYKLGEGTEQDKSVLPEVVPRNHRRHEPGRPYEKDRTYFRWQLPEDTNGWIATGSDKDVMSYRTRYMKSTSIDPKTGKPRAAMGPCDQEHYWHPKVPDEYECCRYSASVLTLHHTKCRTYQLRGGIEIL